MSDTFECTICGKQWDVEIKAVSEPPTCFLCYIPSQGPLDCIKCGTMPADQPSNLCVGCDAYREHQAV